MPEGLEEMIRSAAINLDEIQGCPKLNFHPNPPPPFGTCSKMRIATPKSRGLELAVALSQPSQFLEDAQPLLTQPDTNLRRAIVKLFCAPTDPTVIETFETLLEDG